MNYNNEEKILIWLNYLNISNKNIEKILSRYNSLEEFWNISKKEDLQKLNIRKDTIEKIFTNKEKDILEFSFEKANEYNFVTIFDEKYPKRLLNMEYGPKVLYYKGKLKEDKVNIGIVGSRRHTDYGRWATSFFTRELSSLGVTTISGLARGIDAICHEETLNSNGRTIAVLGNGIDIIYPKANRKIYEKIEKEGLLLSEFYPGTKPTRYNFPKRNRIISALSDSLIIVEAKEKSGSLITANYALEEGKTIYAVPGNINSIFSAGTNKLIQDGAVPLLNIQDILDEYPILEEQVIEESKEVNLSKEEELIYNLLKEGPIHTDELVYKTGIDISSIVSLTIKLELKGLIEEVSQNVYIAI